MFDLSFVLYVVSFGNYIRKLIAERGLAVLHLRQPKHLFFGVSLSGVTPLGLWVIGFLVMA